MFSKITPTGGKFFPNLKMLDFSKSRLIVKTDMRRHIYNLVPLNTNSVSKDELIKLLKNAVALIRTRVDYRVLLIFLFSKAISDKYM